MTCSYRADSRRFDTVPRPVRLHRRTTAEELASGDRVVVTILFTDIVDSTIRAVELGDHRWLALLERHDTLVRSLTRRFGGRVLRYTGDGALTVFPTPTGAIRAAVAMQSGVRAFGLEMRAGAHTGECELHQGEPRGIAFHVGARLMALAEPGEVLVSDALRGLAGDVDLGFVDRGVRALKGLPGEWAVYAAHPA
jgi:class 3 adenylate cyclase